MPFRYLCSCTRADAGQLERPPCTPTKKPRAKSGRGCFAWRQSRPAVYQYFARREIVHDSSQFEDIAGVFLAPSNRVVGPRIFSYSELYIGTSGFSDEEVLGSGSFGRVYRAALPSDGTVVAVKCVPGRGERFQKSFAAELAAVAQLRHRNLVPLRGWCVHDDQLLLVYDYMPNRSLDRLLFPRASAGAPLEWNRRTRIVRGLAAALFYLHEQLDAQIIHRDVKSSNVMLDAAYNARLGDFGLARWLEHDDKQDTGSRSRSRSPSNHQFRLIETSQIGGTIGYLPPESFQGRGSVTAKSDVFSFGVVVLEVATGRRSVDLTYPDDQIFVLDWVRRLSDEGVILSAGDRRLLGGSYPLSEIRRFVHLGLLCSMHDPRSRPSMKWVVEMLYNNSSGELPALPSFRSHPRYISFSSSATTTTTTTRNTTSIFFTATDTTLFFTAEQANESSGGGRNGNGGRCSPRASEIPDVDTPREIPYDKIVAITNDFAESQMVSELDFGTGYQGYMDNGRVHVLVKRLGMRTCPALRARFTHELHSLARLRHRHLVQLRGWCTERGEMLVIYDYSSKSLLSHHLFRNNSVLLAWHHRYSIVKRLASAVLYLHEEWDEQVIHRNITSSAVFLDADMSPRLGCFALAEFLSRNEHGQGHAVLRPVSARGIFGYMAPEYMESGEATTQADVYSFGVVALEIASGLMAVDFRRPEVLMTKKVRDHLAAKRPLMDLADRRLSSEFDHEEMTRLIELGVACTRSFPEARPCMKQIVSILDGNDELLRACRRRKESREDWEGSNAAALALARRIQALGIH